MNSFFIRIHHYKIRVLTTKNSMIAKLAIYLYYRHIELTGYEN